MDGRVDVSVVVPVFNELENLEELYRRRTEAMHRHEYELLFVDDGSTDTSYQILAHLHISYRRVKVVQLAENFGQHAALAAGIEHARGEVIVTMDADLHSDSTDIALLLAKMAEGYDVVSGWRVGRKDGFFTRRFPSYFVNKTVGTVTGIHLYNYNCPLKAFRAEVGRNLMHYGEMHRFLGALIMRLGKSVAEVKVHHHREAMRKLLITGGAGFIGSHFVKYLLKRYQDYHVIILSTPTKVVTNDSILRA
jgi:glycosyltransferase involved in cell wall biosynthesis